MLRREKTKKRVISAILSAMMLSGNVAVMASGGMAYAAEAADYNEDSVQTVKAVPTEAAATEQEEDSKSSMNYVLGRPMTEEEKEEQRRLMEKYISIQEELPVEEGLLEIFGEKTSREPMFGTTSGESVDQPGVDLPAKYDSRDYGYVTPARRQRLGICWAYAVISALEISMVKNEILPLEGLDLSELHLAYFCRNFAEDPLGGTKGDIMSDSNLEKVFGGSFAEYTINPLSAWVGPVQTKDSYDYDNLSMIQNTQEMAYGKRAAILAEVVRIGYNDMVSMKQAIMEYGSLAVSYHSTTNAKYYNHDTAAHYCSKNEGLNHAVTIVGWDDNFSRENFGTTKPSQNGAWLAKNSWGWDFGKNGFFWISYEDQSLTAGTAFRVVAPDTYDNNYQYDGASPGYDLITSSDKIEAVNVFTAKANPGKKELLQAVQFDMFYPNMDYSIQIYKNLTDPTDPTSGTPMLETPITDFNKKSGRYTVDLETPIELMQGDTFAVSVTFTRSDGDVSIEIERPKDHTMKVASEAGQSFYRKQDGAWVDEGAKGKGNLRIKAFTKNLEVTQTDAPQIAYPTAGGLTYGQTLADSTLTGGSTEHGTFAWKDGTTVPTVGNTTGYPVAFTPSEETKKNYQEITDSEQNVQVAVTQATPAISLSSSVSGKSGSRQVVLTATVSKVGSGAIPTGTVQFVNATDGGSTELGSVTLVDGKAIYTWTGVADQKHTIQAVYGGNTNYKAVTAEKSVDTRKQPQMALTPDKDSLSGGGTVTLTLTGLPSGGTATITCDQAAYNPMGSGSSWSVTLPNTTASYTFTASFAGDDTHNSATATCIVNVTRYTAPSGDGHTHSWTTAWTSDSTHHWHECSCGDKKGGAEHVPGAAATETTAQTCTVCGYVIQAALGHIHRGGEATCISKAVCTGCGQPYGDVDSGNHTGGTEVRGKVDATAIKAGYTGDIYCLGCNVKIATGTTVPATGSSGGGYILSGGGGGGYMPSTPSTGTTPSTNPVTGAVTQTIRQPDGSTTEVATGDSTITVAGDVGPESLPFTDVTADDWFYEAVKYVYDKGLMNGVAETAFDSHQSTTRAQLVTILWRLDGQPMVNYSIGFEDVAADQYYTEAVRWAASEGIVEGNRATSFGSSGDITREQLVTILWRYAKYKGIDVSVGENTNILSYEDALDISEYAYPAMQWACGSGLVNGTTDTMLDPGSKANRAQIATIFQRYCEDILK